MQGRGNNNTDRILFAKTPYQDKNAARKALEERHLAPGELAAVRYFISNNGENDNQMCGAPLRMLIGCGGMDPFTGKDVFIFEDNGSHFEFVDTNGNINKFTGLDEVINFILESLNGFSGNINNYYTKDEINIFINEINEAQSNFITKNEIEELTTIVDTKVDAKYVEDFFETNVASKVEDAINDINISEIVNTEINEKLKDLNVVSDIEFNELKNEILNNNEAVASAINDINERITDNELNDAAALITTNDNIKSINNQITTIFQNISSIENQIKDLDTDIDGSEEPNWV